MLRTLGMFPMLLDAQTRALIGDRRACFWRWYMLWIMEMNRRNNVHASEYMHCQRRLQVP